MTGTWVRLLPELRQLPPAERAAALRRARATPWDTFELCGMAVAPVAVTAPTRYVPLDDALATRLVAAAIDFAVALPLLALALAPLQWRRLRRGLPAQLRAQRNP